MQSGIIADGAGSRATYSIPPHEPRYILVSLQTCFRQRVYLQKRLFCLVNLLVKEQEAAIYPYDVIQGNPFVCDCHSGACITKIMEKSVKGKKINRKSLINANKIIDNFNTSLTAALNIPQKAKRREIFKEKLMIFLLRLAFKVFVR